MTTREERRAKRRKAILETFRKVGTIKGAARRLHMSRRAIRRALNGQDTPRQKPPATPTPRPSKLDPYKPLIGRLVLEDELTATLVLDEIRELGYAGGYSILKEYVRTIRPFPMVAATIRLTHEPGSPAQVDWSPHPVTLGGEPRIGHCFSLVLPFSRYMVVRYGLDETVETLIAMHDEAFLDLKGVPAVITYDYVAGHIIVVMCQRQLCGRTQEGPRRAGKSPARRAHKSQSESSHASRVLSSRHTGLRGNAAEDSDGGSHRRRASSFARMLISA